MQYGIERVARGRLRCVFAALTPGRALLGPPQAPEHRKWHSRAMRTSASRNRLNAFRQVIDGPLTKGLGYRAASDLRFVNPLSL